jgi:hypothetical protein
LTLLCVRRSDQYRYSANNPSQMREAQTLDLCRELVSTPAVQQAIVEFYQPGQPFDPRQDAGTFIAPDKSTMDEWSTVEPGELTFHQFGTTSMILSGLTTTLHGQCRRYALKCIL